MKKILFLYRNSQMGFSIGKVFRPIEVEMKKYAEVDHFEMPCSGYSFLSLIKNINASRKKAKNFDIIHITGQEHYLIPFLDRTKLVITVHDLGSIVGSENGLKGFIKHLFFIKTLALATRITSISESTKAEIIRLCRVNPNRITVIPNALDPIFVNTPMPQSSVPRILQIGATPNKNLERTIMALKGVNCHLRIISSINQILEKKLIDSGIDYSVSSSLTDEEIYQEYKNCNIVSFPSLYEGFGMPIIEGQAAGRVVVTSNLSPMQDVAGDAAVFVDPTDVQSIREGFMTAMRIDDSLVSKGLINVKRFEVSKIVRAYMRVYSAIAIS